MSLRKKFQLGYSTNKKPTCPVEIDWSNPLTEGLRHFFIITERGIENLVEGTADTTVPVSGSANGLCYQRGASDTDTYELTVNNAYDVNDSGSGYYGPAQSHIFSIEILSQTTSWRTIARLTNSATTGYDADQLAIGVKDTNEIDFYAYGNAVSLRTWLDLNTDYVQNKVHSFASCGDLTTSNGKQYVDGVSVAPDNTTPSSWSDTLDTFKLGFGSSGNEYRFYHAMFFDRVLTQAQVKALSDNPYQILKPIIQTIGFVGSAAGGTTISGTLETLILTEYAATVNNETVVTGTLDTLTLTEYQATVTQGVNVTGTLEILTLTEYPATINDVKNVTGTLETLTLTEYAATITEGAATNITGTLETLTLNEHPATVSYTLKVTATLETLTLTTFKADISYVAPDTDNITGGWEYPEGPTKEQVKQERIRLGIIKPETPVKTAFKVKTQRQKYPEIRQLTTLEKEIKQIESLKDHFKAKSVRQPKTQDKDIFIQIQLSLNMLDQQRQQIEEQDIVFMMSMLIA